MKEKARSFCRWVWVCAKKYTIMPFRISIGAYLQRRNEKKPIYKTYRFAEIFMQQNHPNGYKRWDIIVRLLAIENEMGINSYGWDLYKKMQVLRNGDDEDGSIERVQRFKRLIYETVDYHSIPIVLDSELKLYDGSHRMALAIYNNDRDIKVFVDRRLGVTDTEYGEEWFRDNGFTEYELEIIRSRVTQLVSRYEIKISFVLWPSVLQYYNAIVDDIIQLGYNIIETKDVSCNDITFENIVKTVYSIDDVDNWKVESKLEHMRECEDKTIRYISISFVIPHYRIKKQNNNLILREGEELKSLIRTKWQTKVDNYFFDIICHSADNLNQSEVIERIFNPTVSVNDYLPRIDNCDYVAIKTCAPYNKGNSFDFAFGKDLDIICKTHCYERVKEITKAYVYGLEDDLYKVTEVNDGDATRYRIMMNNHLVYQFDISSNVDGIDMQAIEDTIDSRQRNGAIYVPALQYELLYILNEYLKHPSKKYHLNFLKQNKDLLDYELLKYVDGSERFMSSN